MKKKVGTTESLECVLEKKESSRFLQIWDMVNVDLLQRFQVLPAQISLDPPILGSNFGRNCLFSGGATLIFETELVAVNQQKYEPKEDL